MMTMSPPGPPSLTRRSKATALSLVLAASCGAGTPPAEPAPSPRAPAPITAGPRFPVMYLDMDGTLLGSDHQLRPATTRALADYQRCGGRYGVATGRTIEQVRSFLDQLTPDLPLVLFNGAALYDPTGERLLSASTVPAAAVAALLEQIGDDERVEVVLIQLAEQTLAYPDSDRLEEVAQMLHLSIERACGAPAGCLEPGQEPIKLLVITDGDLAQELVDDIEGGLPPGVRAVVGYPSAVEVTAEGVDKSVAIRAVLEGEGLTMDQAVVIGDSANDLEMLSDVPVSIAMEGCHPSSCAAALLRAGSNDSDTIAEILDDLVMGPACRR